ncbi:MAG: N-acetylmuramoyl-L-alanine amidase [Gemmatimonadaceae bacterium]|nr:N-acetylmuramoyl-L-alanine amidase [Gemmatimonadaceae bacterium]
MALTLLAPLACSRSSGVAVPPAPVAGARPVSVARAVETGLPAVPAVRGAPLAIQVRYPGENQVITSRDSNFILGAIGSGDATLTINGRAVAVAPNGAFLGWLPNPTAEASRYDLVAVRGSDTARRTIRVRFPTRTPLSATGALRVDSGSLQPARGTWARSDELLRVSLRAPSNARVRVESARGQRALVTAGTGSAADAAVTWSTDVPVEWMADSAAPARVVVVRDRDSVDLRIPAVRSLPRTSRLLAQLRSANTVGSDTDRVVNARTNPGGTYKWLLIPGTVLEVTGRQGGSTRLALDGALDVWVDNGDMVLMPEGTALPRRISGGFRVSPASEWVDVVIGTGERPAHHVEAGGREITLTLYGVQANPDISPIFGNDTLIRRIAWEQVTTDRVRVTLSLSEPAFGWLSMWDDARRAFVLRVRRLPAIDPAQPLRGLTIAVDPGHPPAGSTGPTGLYEGDAVFPVGMKLVEMLKARGANVFSTRNSLAAVGLTERGVATRRGNAHAFLSIHLNALPDGVNPFTANGTSTLFFHNVSEPLARHVQTALMARFGLRDLGVHYQNLAVARPTWYPSMLAEGLFIMLPEQEAAMRDEGFQRKYAEALVVGVEQYFRELAEGRLR